MQQSGGPCAAALAAAADPYPGCSAAVAAAAAAGYCRGHAAGTVAAAGLLGCG